MNDELIQKLVDQCVDKRVRDGRTVEVLQSRKFAELIVRECANQLDDGAEDGMWVRSVLYKHFGVEE